MLRITIPDLELFDEEGQQFVYEDGATLDLEHSLVSLSKWESIWEKPFLSDKTMTDAQLLSYIECMVVSPEFDAEKLNNLSDDNLSAIRNHIQAKMTATWFGGSSRSSREVVTSEIIYYWMITLGIPTEYENWHLNRLFTLIRVCGSKNAPAKKMGASELATRNRELNEARRRELNTKG